jgi:hypothetical protein
LVARFCGKDMTLSLQPPKSPEILLFIVSFENAEAIFCHAAKGDSVKPAEPASQKTMQNPQHLIYHKYLLIIFI